MEPEDTNGPGKYLLTHEAPDDLLQKAWVQGTRPPRHPVRTTLVVVALLLVGGVLGRTLPLPGGAEAPAPDLVLAQADLPAVVPVRLVCACEGAGRAAVAGTWNGWNPEATRMERVDDGLFAITVYLEPGRYEYQFVLDGDRWVTDRVASNWHDDGFGSRNAVIEI